MKVVISKSKEYKSFTDLFYKNKQSGNYKELLTKAYNTSVFQSGYLDLPEEYIQNIPEIFEYNAENIFSDQINVSGVDIRTKIHNAIKRYPFILGSNKYMQSETKSEVLFGLGYFEPNTALTSGLTPDINDIEPIQIISPRPLFLIYKNVQGAVDNNDGTAVTKYEYQKLINSANTALYINNTSLDDCQPDYTFYNGITLQLDTGVVPEDFLWIKSSLLKNINTDGIPFTDNVKEIEVHNIDAIRLAYIESKLKYYLIKDRETGEIYKRIAKNGKEYLAPEVISEEKIYTNEQLADKAYFYNINVKIGDEKININDIPQDTELVDAVKAEVLKLRKKHGDMTFEDASRSTLPLNYTGKTRETQPFAGFPQTTETTNSDGTIGYDGNLVLNNVIESLTTNKRVILGNRVYTVSGIKVVTRPPVKNIQVGSTKENNPNLSILKYTAISDTATILLIDDVIVDVDTKIKCVLYINEDTFAEFDLVLDKLKNINTIDDIQNILTNESITDIIEIELDKSNKIFDLAKYEYHICSAMTRHTKLSIAETAGNTNTSSTIPVRSLDGYSFNNDGKIVVENVELEKSI